jgi:predicted Rossmann fold flavoprotein
VAKTLYDVMILGGGAGGLMCAAWLNENSALKVGVIEGNAKVAQKLKISGGGKCNITNVEVDASHFLGDESTVASVLKQFSKEDLLKWLKGHGLRPVVRKGRYFFCPQSSEEIISILRKASSPTAFFLTHTIESVTKAEHYVIKTDKAGFEAKTVVVATGGASFRTLGATDAGLKIAASFGHGIKPFRPALVGLTLQPEQFWMKELSGISFPVEISVGGKKLREDMLFAHRGISGPAVLSASLYWSKGEISIDFLPHKKIESLCKGQRRQVGTVIPLPRRFTKLFLEQIGVRDKPCNALSKEEIKRLETIHAYAFAPSGNFGFTKAEVSKGGVPSCELDPKTLESRKEQGLYFIGEVVDVTGELGGYNFQWAFSSAVAAARKIIKNI